MDTDQVKVTSEWVSDKFYIKFNFIGHLKEDLADLAIAKWKELLQNELKDENKANVIWNCEYMTGYESEARKKWQQMMKDTKGSTGDIWIVSSKTMFLVAARTMALLTNYNLKAAKSEIEIFDNGSSVSLAKVNN